MNCFSLSSKDGSAGGCMATVACAGPAAAGAGTTALGPGRSGRLRAFLLGLGLLDGQIDFPLRGEGEDLHGDLLPLGEVVVDVADKGSGHL